MTSGVLLGGIIIYEMVNGQRSMVNGQAMVLAIVVLGGTILGATTIAGLLMIFQIRQATDAASSARALFAADTGIECGLYNFFKVPPASPCPSEQTLSNRASYTETTSASSTIVSRGSFGNTRRAFLFRLLGATTTIP